jgi:CheY-like chemotaxis protein
MSVENGKNQTILVVEDDHDTRVSIRYCLEYFGFQVESVTNGAEALGRLYKGLNPQAILLDMYMPIMNGRQFIEAVKNHPTFSKIPIVQLSAQTDELVPGALAALTKPIALQELLEQIRLHTNISPPALNFEQNL